LRSFSVDAIRDVVLTGRKANEVAKAQLDEYLVPDTASSRVATCSGRDGRHAECKESAGQLHRVTVPLREMVVF
jgi:hypothetical protein